MFGTTFKKEVFGNSDHKSLPKNNKTKGYKRSENQVFQNNSKTFCFDWKTTKLKPRPFPGD